jgi:F-type H+-transporting ATPase subunit b
MGHGLFWPFVNFSILLGVLAYYLRQPIRAFVDARSKRVGQDVELAAKALAGARAELAEHQSKLQAIKAEADSLKSQATQEAEAITVRIVSDAKRSATEILEDAQRAAKTLMGIFAGSSLLS